MRKKKKSSGSQKKQSTCKRSSNQINPEEKNSTAAKHNKIHIIYFAI